MEDVLLFAAGLLAEEEAVAAQVRRQYKWLVVDEFQDVSPLQSALLDLWLGGRDELCVVGDPAQTIYSFAGRQRRLPARVHHQVPRRDLHRAGAQLPLDPGGRRRRQPPARGHAEQGRRPGRPAAVRQPGALHRAPRRGGRGRGGRRPRSPRCAPPARLPARWRCCSGSTPSPRRSRTRSPRGASRTSSAARPASSTGREVRQAVTLLRGTARGGQEDGTVPDLVRATLSGMGWSAEAPGTRGETRNRWESLQALVDQSTEFVAEQPGATLGDFVDDLDRRAAEQHAPLADGVTLATLHAAKGLEWDAVFLCGLQDGTLPITYADTPAAVEEERRLLYVGMTRARRELSISWALARNPGGRASRKPSRFLDEVAEVERAAASERAHPPQPQGHALPRVRHRAEHPRGEEARPLRGLPRVLRRGAVRAPARVAPRAGRRRQGARRSSSSPTPPCSSSPSTGRPTRGRCGASAGWVPPSSAKYGDDVLALVSRRKSEEIPIKSFAHYTGHALVFSPTAHAHATTGTGQRPTPRRRWHHDGDLHRHHDGLDAVLRHARRRRLPARCRSLRAAARRPSRRLGPSWPAPPSWTPSTPCAASSSTPSASREPSRVRPPGDHRSSDTRPRSAASRPRNPHRDPRPFCFSDNGDSWAGSRRARVSSAPAIRSTRRR